MIENAVFTKSRSDFIRPFLGENLIKFGPKYDRSLTFLNCRFWILRPTFRSLATARGSMVLSQQIFYHSDKIPEGRTTTCKNLLSMEGLFPLYWTVGWLWWSSPRQPTNWKKESYGKMIRRLRFLLSFLDWPMHPPITQLTNPFWAPHLPFSQSFFLGGGGCWTLWLYYSTKRPIPGLSLFTVLAELYV